MANNAIPLQDLAKRITKQEAELDKLRQEYQTRQAHLTDLARRKDDLLAQLRQVEAEIHSLDKGITVVGKTAANPKKTPQGNVSLSQFLLQVVLAAGRPVTTEELAAEVVRSKFPTTGSNIAGLVGTQIYQMVKKGVLRRTKDQSGVVSAQPQPIRAVPTAKAKTAMPKAQTAAAAGLSLPTLLAKILAESDHPLTARALAEKALARGYKTKSKDFTNVIWVSIGKIANIENVAGQGYRLKRGTRSK